MSDTRRPTPEEALALLAWYREAGVDETVGDTPVDRLAAPAPDPPDAPAPTASGETPAPREPAAPAPSPVTATGGGAASDPVLVAREKARAATTLTELRNLLEAFEGCPLRFTAKNLCFADGNPEARIMFVGEAPGAEEDIQGRPFVGRAGRLFDKMLDAIGLSRESAYITNIIYWRPPGNRTPTPHESQTCRPFIERHIALADPDVLVLLGGAAAKELLGRSDGILKMRGKWFEYDTGTRRIPAMPTLHPAYLLRQPGQKRLAWRDFLAVREKLSA